MLDVRINRSHDVLSVGFREGEIFFRSRKPDIPLSLYDDFAVWALLPIAMKNGATIRIRGRIHGDVQRAAEDYAFIWHNWMPMYYLPIKIVADKVINESPRTGTDKSLLALSGGVDSTFALLKNTHADITHVLAVHGLDYFLSDTEVFSGVLERTEKIAAKAGKEHLLLETNVREWMKEDWWLSHAPALTAVMSCFSDAFGARFVASDRTRWMDNFLGFNGSNHVTNACLHAKGYGVSYLDQEFDRIDKLAFIIDEHPEYSELVTFCFKRHVSGNCGWCYKCSTQKLFLLALQGHLEPFFPGQEFTERNMRKLRKLHDAVARTYFMKALAMARSRGHEVAVPFLESLIEDHLSSWRTMCTIDPSNRKYMAIRNILNRLRGKKPIGHGKDERKGVSAGYVDYVIRRTLRGSKV